MKAAAIAQTSAQSMQSRAHSSMLPRQADVLGGDPLAPEVPALHHEVRRDDDMTRAHAEHSGVVAGAHEHLLALLEEAGQLPDEGELTDVGDGRVRGKSHGAHPTRPRPSATYRHARAAR